MDKEQQFQTEIYKANQIIRKLEERIGALEGYAAKLETDNELLRTYIAEKEKEKQKKKETPKVKED